ncbi:helix-turn-helix domain-containing protein [Arthrobacter sp.]|uniref:helix-turn-helix domain-containing protein n=1 Tax=Arthrobacter sp. TaxID=1667 RepID=UPI003A8FF3D1
MSANLDPAKLDSHDWSVGTDADRITEIVRSVSGGPGVLLFGEPGAGQVDFAAETARRLGKRSAVVEVSCPPDHGTSSELDSLLEHPPAAGLVLHIPDINSFAGPDVEKASRLVLLHGAVVIAASSDPLGSPDAALTRHLKLERRRVRDLSLKSAGEFLERGLGSPLSGRSIHAVWNSGAGNRMMMRMIVSDWIDLDFLVRIDGVWAIRGLISPPGSRLIRHWKQRLAGVEPGVRRVFELLALSGELPLGAVLDIGGADSVDVVHELGYLHLRDNTGREASLRGAINASAIAGQVPPGRSRTLLEIVTEYVDSRGMHRPPGLVHWRLRCGLPVSPSRIIEGAEHLLQLAAPVEAVKLLNRLDPADVSSTSNGLRIGALLASGQFVNAWSHVGNLRMTGLGQKTGRGEESTTPSKSAAEVIQATWLGDFRDLLRAGTFQPELPTRAVWLWNQLVIEGQVITGDVRGGLQRGRELLHLLEQTDVETNLIQRCRIGLFDLEVLAGEWARADGTLSNGDADADSQGREHGGSLYTAIAEVLSGRYGDAVARLQTEIPQLRALGRHDLLPLAHSVRALGLAASGHLSEACIALSAVDQAPLDSRSGQWRIRWGTNYLWAQAMGLVGRSSDAVTRLLEYAQRDHDLGNVSQELMSLSAALQLGHAPALDLLAEASGHADGRFAEACTWVVRGLTERDPHELEYASLLLRAMGQNFFADYVQKQLELINGPCAAAAEPAASLASKSGTMGGRAAFAQLTSRQRLVVDLIMKNHTNLEISRMAGISVRTVESHLYQVYAKLNVASRGELREILAE